MLSEKNVKQHSVVFTLISTRTYSFQAQKLFDCEIISIARLSVQWFNFAVERHHVADIQLYLRCAMIEDTFFCLLRLECCFIMYYSYLHSR